jgi:hypothetical protein
MLLGLFRFRTAAKKFQKQAAKNVKDLGFKRKQNEKQKSEIAALAFLFCLEL